MPEGGRAGCQSASAHPTERDARFIPDAHTAERRRRRAHGLSRDGAWSLCSGAAGGFLVTERLLLFTAHHHHVSMAHALNGPAAHRELRAGTLGDVRGSGLGGDSVQAVRQPVGSPGRHPAGPDPHVRCRGRRPLGSGVCHSGHASGEQLQTHGDPGSQTDPEDAGGNLVLCGRSSRTRARVVCGSPDGPEVL